jgi:peptidoglycan/xylan/chitin deacetylase (PgdA/CDA1 family)
MRNAALSAINRRQFELNSVGPVVSFTFDDFPRSALTVGGPILKNYGVCGTYYAAMGLMEAVNGLGKQFCAEDLAILLAQGHELGSHTFGHLSARSTPLEQFVADALKGKAAVEQITGGERPHSFSYPYGHVSLRVKRRLGRAYASCRGIVPGVNHWPVDLNLLKANSVYHHAFNPGRFQRLLEEATRTDGWLIFYTHDVSESPSDFGCTPAELERLVQLVSQTGARVLTVCQVLSGACLRGRIESFAK